MSYNRMELCDIKDRLTRLVENAMSENIHAIDTHEMGEVVDLIKDLSQAIYYESITEYNAPTEYGRSFEYSGQGDPMYDREEHWLDVDNAADNVRKIWKEADPNHKAILKSNLQQLLMEMDRG